MIFVSSIRIWLLLDIAFFILVTIFFSNIQIVINVSLNKLYPVQLVAPKLRYTTRAGPRNGLILELDVQHRYYLPVTPKAGAKVVVHDHDEVPFPEDGGVLVGPGIATSIALSQTITRRLPPPYGKCIRQTEARMRELSIFPSGKYNYTDIACRKSCFQKALISKCQCCDPLLPCENDTFFKISNSTQRFCNISLNVHCVFQVEFMFYNGSFDCAKYCPFECEAVVFNTAISTAAWPSDQYLQAIAKKVSQTILKNTTFEAIDNVTLLVQKNLLRVEVFFQTLDVQEIITKPAYDWAMVCADVGGQLWLWLGFSILTGMELVELIVDAVSLIVRKLYVKDLAMKRPARSDIQNKC